MFKSLCESDNYETPISVWRQLLPHLKEYKTILDPFYCNGRAKIYWEDLGKKCLHYDCDAYQIIKPPARDFAIVTNPPFSELERAVTFLLSFGNDTFILIPISILQAGWFQALIASCLETGGNFEILPITLRSGFIKDGIQLKASPVACCFVAFTGREPRKRVRLGDDILP